MSPQEDIFAFLRSTRFWAAVTGAFAAALTQTNLRLAFAAFFGALATAFITIKTVDRVTDQATKDKVDRSKPQE